jgi:hypothetical protein
MNTLKTLFACVALMVSAATFAQVTTSGMSGRVSDSRESLMGASVTVTHEPSGTVYGTITNEEGRYSIQGMRTGGPYCAKVHFLGYGDFTRREIYLQLGEEYVLDIRLSESDQTLDEVVVATKAAKFAGTKTGSMTNINSRTMSLIPSVNRSLSDYTKLSPYASGTGSFGGRPAYTTNITVDGANFNNNFGLEDNPMPGPSITSADPISMEAVEEMQVAVAPFDVRQSNFTGAGVNVVTKSGGNELHGSAYSFFRSKDMNGTKIGSLTLTSEAERQVYGLSVGGPIVRNKLFFFVNAEMEDNLTPGNTLLAQNEGRNPNDPNVSDNVTAKDLEAFSGFLREKFGYETGRYENWGGDNESSRKLLAKIDWNINQRHKASFRYNYSKVESISRAHPADDCYPQLTRERHAKTGGISFENSQYSNPGSLHSLTAELNSNFSDVLSNKLLAAYTHYNQKRESTSDIFPFIDIMNGTETEVLMSAGYELYSYNNAVGNNTLILTDNVTYHGGRHTITGGLSYENQYTLNDYWRQGTGYYRFKNLDAFKAYANGEGEGQPYDPKYHPLNFAFTYPFSGRSGVTTFRFGQFSVYAQDEWQLSNAFKLTYGLRIDAPVYLSESTGNLDMSGYTFRNGEKIDLSTWPKVSTHFAPRVGFNYDLTEDKSVKLRGGAGIFTGRVPLVWFVNQIYGGGGSMARYHLVLNQRDGVEAQAKLAELPFAGNILGLVDKPELAGIFPTENVRGGTLDFVDKKFKLPQVLRASLGADIRLPENFLLTVVGTYSKDIYAVHFENINLKEPDAVLLEGDNERPYRTDPDKRYIDSTYTNVIAMRNINKGWSALGSVRLTFPEYNGFSGTVAYSFSHVREVAGKNGYNGEAFDTDEMGFSMNNTPHRIILSAAYRIDYANFLRSTFSVFYTGCSGRAFSYLYAGDANGDGTAYDLMYIPRSKEDFVWSNAGDADKYFAYAAKDPYLSEHAGEYAQLYGAHEPFAHQIDLRFLQDFYLNVGGKRHTVQLNIDVLNLPNLLNSSWGINRIYIAPNVTPLTFEGRDAATGKPVVSVDRNVTDKNGPYQDPVSVSAAWSLQVGVRYIF